MIQFSSTPVAVSRKAARRFLLNALSLAAKPRACRLSDVRQQITELEAVQIDPVARVGRNQDLALLARNPRYRPHLLDELLQRQDVFEYRANEACVLPIEDYLALEGVRRRLTERLGAELERFPHVIRMIKSAIEARGALPSRAFATDNKVFGYWDTAVAATKETSHVINLLVDVGQLMVVRREGVTRYFDLPAHVLPSEVIQQSREIADGEADEMLFDKYVRAYRFVNGRHSRLGWGGHPVGIRQQMLNTRVAQGSLIPVAVDQVSSPYYVLAEDAEKLQALTPCGASPRFLPPLDNLLWDRQRLVDLFDFHYRWEVYVPAAKRQFGVYAMPVLSGDRLIGRIDPELQRKEAILAIHNVEWEDDVRITPSLTSRVDEAATRLAAALGASRVVWPNGLF